MQPAMHAQGPDLPAAHRHGGVEGVPPPSPVLERVSALAPSWAGGAVCAGVSLVEFVWLWPGVLWESLSALSSPVPALEPSLLPWVRRALGSPGQTCLAFCHQHLAVCRLGVPV